ncbi:hypothetical protein DEU56DRAFT_738481, partial [Suillus clintonianus]|uniref:uncharacterized protein n=1 Tax=Suillus clintonianus TaxID=1904413 RepID=UPI001B87E3B2
MTVWSWLIHLRTGSNLEAWRTGSSTSRPSRSICTFADGEQKTLHFHLGPLAKHTVYEAEIVGMILGAELLRREPGKPSARLCVDNQAAILATQSFRTNPGHYLMDMFHRNLERALIKRDEDHITIHWTPGHADIEGNESADVEAKKAAGGLSSPPNNLPNCLR